MAIVVENDCFAIIDLGRLVWEVFDLYFFIIGSFCFTFCWLFIGLRVVMEVSEEVDIEDWLRENKFLLDG